MYRISAPSAPRTNLRRRRSRQTLSDSDDDDDDIPNETPGQVEAANGPVTSYADDYLFKKNVLVLPDILVNSGNVISSYFEWLKNIDHAIPGKMTKRVLNPPVFSSGNGSPT